MAGSSEGRSRKWQECRCWLFLLQGQCKGEKLTVRPDYITAKIFINESSKL